MENVDSRQNRDGFDITGKPEETQVIEGYDSIVSLLDSSDVLMVPADINRETKNVNNRVKQLRSDTYGSFYVDDTELALSVSCVQEVVNAPANYLPLPLAPNYFKGLFNLRGSVIPVVDIRVIMNQGSMDNRVGKVAILEEGGYRVGILFDDTGEIFRARPDERCDFNNENGNIISGVFKKDNGNRIVQIIDVPRMYKLYDIDTSLAIKDGDNCRGFFNQRNKGSRKQCISFLVGPARCALSIDAIQEILKVEKLRYDLMVDNCLGTIELRGNVVPIVDFASFLKFRTPDRSQDVVSGDRRVLVLRYGNVLLGLLVDAVESLITYYPECLVRLAVPSVGASRMFKGCITDTVDGDTLLLDHDQIMGQGEIDKYTRGGSKLFSDNNSFKLKEHEKGLRKTFITFVIQEKYGVPIGDVREIINMPSDLLYPPGLPSVCKGVFNLRGNLLIIIDGRSMYGKPQNNGHEFESKVLIFKNKDTMYGLVVDSIEAIISFQQSEAVVLPELFYRKRHGSLTSDVSEAYQVDLGEGVKESLLIINPNAIAQRVLGEEALIDSMLEGDYSDDLLEHCTSSIS
jgi:purine-binding chemotaxis protein CheW